MLLRRRLQARRPWLLATLPLLVLWLAALRAPTQGEDPLPSWNDGPVKQAILEFVAAVTDPDHEDFVPVPERVATFDNDGTLWCEKPLYIHVTAVVDQMRKQLAADASLASRQPYRSLAEDSLSHLDSLVESHAIPALVGELFGVPFGGMTAEAYEAWARTWYASWRHPRFDVGYAGLVYQPMVELLRLLHEKDFTVYVVTADEAAFVRLVSEEIYDVPRQRVLGTVVRCEYSVEDGEGLILRSYRDQYVCNQAGKPRRIYQNVGRRPILAAGNTNGDQQMLQWTGKQDRRSLSLFVHHTDAEREYAYDGDTDTVLPLGKQDGWSIISTERDWKRIFPEQDGK